MRPSPQDGCQTAVTVVDIVTPPAILFYRPLCLLFILFASLHLINTSTQPLSFSFSPIEPRHRTFAIQIKRQEPDDPSETSTDPFSSPAPSTRALQNRLRRHYKVAGRQWDRGRYEETLCLMMSECKLAGLMNVTENWKLRVDGGEIVGRPAVLSDGDIIVGTLQGSVYRINPTANGETLGARPLVLLSVSLHLPSSVPVYAGSIVGAPVVDQEDSIYFGSGDRKVGIVVFLASFLTAAIQIWALTPDGMTKWQYLTREHGQLAIRISYASLSEQPLMTAPLLLDMMYLYDGSYSDPGFLQLVIGGLDGILYKLNLDGTEAWKFQTNGQIRGSASVTHDGRVIVAAIHERPVKLSADSVWLDRHVPLLRRRK
eukprot:749670-Hanusia_phi.AAC.1